MMTAASSPNERGDQVGAISELFWISWVTGQYRRRFKAWNRAAYQLGKATLIVALAALIILV